MRPEATGAAVHQTEGRPPESQTYLQARVHVGKAGGLPNVIDRRLSGS